MDTFNFSRVPHFMTVDEVKGKEVQMFIKSLRRPDVLRDFFNKLSRGKEEKDLPPGFPFVKTVIS